MLIDHRFYREIISRVRRPTLSIIDRSQCISSDQYLEMSTTYGLGSGLNGKILYRVSCANSLSRGLGTERCHEIGLISCSQCSLVKYCSGKCQRNHWPKHRIDCENPYLQASWEPEWMIDDRQPMLSDSKFLPTSSSIDNYKNVGHPPYDVLQIRNNEGLNIGSIKDYKICMTAAADIRNLIETVKHLPRNYSGRLDVLINNSNSLVLNRMLVILCALLFPGPSLDESSELATHLMYSAMLPETASSYVKYCSNIIYGDGPKDSEITFQTSLRTRGCGRMSSAQPASSIRKIREIFSSTYSFTKAVASMKEVLMDPFQIDDRHKMLSMLTPQHKVALDRFWATGVLAPFSMDLRAFKSPNKLLFTAQGEWQGLTSNINPLHGWDVSAVQSSGIKHGADPTGDILGCLFFHIKDELRELCLRVKGMNINIHLVQYDPRLLSKGISIGILPAFVEASFDRIDIGDMSDQVAVSECLTDWGPLLNRINPHSRLIMHSKRWHEEFPNSIARNNPRAVKVLMEKCEGIPSVKSKLKTFFKGPQAPSLFRLMASLDAFVDHEPAFLHYLEVQEAQNIVGLKLCQTHSVHPKRIGISLHSSVQKLPNLTKEEYYNLFILGGADLTLRFAEFERTGTD